MYYPESDTILLRKPELAKVVGKLDVFLHSLTLGECQQIDPEQVATILNLPVGQVRQVFHLYREHDLLREKTILHCQYNDNAPIRAIGSTAEMPITTYCDLCGCEHEFTAEEVATRYELTRPNIVQPATSTAVSPALKPIDTSSILNMTPLLAYLPTKVGQNPFKGKRCLIILHFLKDLICFMHACERLGLDPSQTFVFFKHDLYPHLESVRRYLIDRGYNVFPLRELEKVVLVIDALSQRDPKPVIIIEDGGYLVPFLHNSKLDICSLTLGAVEQTTKGQRRDKEIEASSKLRFPVISIAECHLKTKYEPQFVADAVVNNVRNLIPDITIRSKNALVVGYGSVGKNIAKRLQEILRMDVTVYEIDSQRKVEASGDGCKVVDDLAMAVKDKVLIIGATGETSLNTREFWSMGHNTYLVSASSDQLEINLGELKAISAKEEELLFDSGKIGTRYVIRGTDIYINVLADGYPISFWASESMPNNVSDLILSLMLISAVEIALNPKALPNSIDTTSIEQYVEKWKVAELYMQHHYPGSA